MDEKMIVYTQGQVLFPQYEEVVQWAKDIAEALSSTELREDNVKEVKARLAAARKVVDGINAKRIEVKKAMLAPYTTLEAQVKDITEIINDADAILRDKVRAMEEAEREAKRETLKGIWDTRIQQYTFPAYIPDAFNSWLTPQHLNKTCAISKSETDMTQWMEQRERDVLSIMTVPDSAQILIAYSRTLDLASAMAEGQEQARREKAVYSGHDVPNAPATATFIVTGEKDIQLAELLFKTNNIDYRRV